jgi:hypothetical protein
MERNKKSKINNQMNNINSNIVTARVVHFKKAYIENTKNIEVIISFIDIMKKNAKILGSDISHHIRERTIDLDEIIKEKVFSLVNRHKN